MPSDPYSEEACIYRAYNYRNHVTHRRNSPVLLRVGSGPPICCVLDPRNPDRQLTVSIEWAQAEMAHVLRLFTLGCQRARTALQQRGQQTHAGRLAGSRRGGVRRPRAGERGRG
jgi:hypothetical protein